MCRVYPSLYYNFSYVAGNGVDRVRADFLMIDTIQLCGNTRDVNNGDFLDVISMSITSNEYTFLCR